MLFRIGKRPFDRIAIVPVAVALSHAATAKFWAGFFQDRRASRNSGQLRAFIHWSAAPTLDPNSRPVHFIATVSPRSVTRGPWTDSFTVTTTSAPPFTRIVSWVMLKSRHTRWNRYRFGSEAFTVSR